MKRFALFTWTDHEAHGGWGDLCGLHDTLEDACKHGVKWVGNDPGDWNCWHVVDLTVGKIVADKHGRADQEGSHEGQ